MQASGSNSNQTQSRGRMNGSSEMNDGVANGNLNRATSVGNGTQNGQQNGASSDIGAVVLNGGTEADNGRDGTVSKTRVPIRSWVWKHMNKVNKKNARGVPRDYVVCQVNNCGHETLFCGTHAITNHLVNDHGLIEPPKELDQVEEADETATSSREKRTNMLLLNFITSGYLPFSIVENHHFRRFTLLLDILLIILI